MASRKDAAINLFWAIGSSSSPAHRQRLRTEAAAVGQRQLGGSGHTGPREWSKGWRRSGGAPSASATPNYKVPPELQELAAPN
uniref:Uncharacterized protein n=1 Tax=Aegilops tauschii TaxID=37682 RepID=M8BUW3_AEGTA